MDYEEDDEDPIEEALGQAYYDYIRAIGEIICDLNAEELQKIENKIKNYNHVSQAVVLHEIDFHRKCLPFLERARELGASIYCLEHDSDIENCRNKHEND